jgi:hypothetical protein
MKATPTVIRPVQVARVKAIIDRHDRSRGTDAAPGQEATA